MKARALRGAALRCAAGGGGEAAAPPLPPCAALANRRLITREGNLVAINGLRGVALMQIWLHYCPTQAPSSPPPKKNLPSRNMRNLPRFFRATIAPLRKREAAPAPASASPASFLRVTEAQVRVSLLRFAGAHPPRRHGREPALGVARPGRPRRRHRLPGRSAPALL